MTLMKGSAQAIAWGKKMQKIRKAGLRMEKQFFGPGGVFAKAGHGFTSPEEAYNNAVRYIQRHPEIFKNNLGEAWHRGMEAAAGRQGRQTREPLEKALLKGMKVADRDSAGAARRLGMNPRRLRRNPLAVFGFANPPERVNTGVAGIVYNVCHEIRAEKTGYKRGLYRHPFSKASGVQILALDNGDLLVHSTRKVRLWKRS